MLNNSGLLECPGPTKRFFFFFSSSILLEYVQQIRKIAIIVCSRKKWSRGKDKNVLKMPFNFWRKTVIIKDSYFNIVKKKRGRQKTTWQRNIEAEVNNIQHSWYTVHRLVSYCEEWIEFVATLQDTAEHAGQWFIS